jgi:DNA-binding response OmpR family regulator
MVKNVLVVDDDTEMLASLQSGLAKYQDTFAILTAEDGRVAMDKLREHTISLVVTDLKMPRLDGFALLQHIMEKYPDIPVIVITGYSTPEMERLAREGGAVGYIAKPFMLDSLARKVMSTLRQESEGGTLHSVSSGIFLQLMEMEQKTCTIRLVDKASGKKGVLFFKEGTLLDARVDDLQGKAAAYKIFSWDKVTISIQNVCPEIDNRIQSDLQPLILEASRIKDEAGSPAPSAEPHDAETESAPRDEAPSPRVSIAEIKQTIEKKFGPRSGLEDIYRDDTWDTLLHQLEEAGELLGSGSLRCCYIDRGDPFDYIILPGKAATVLAVNPKCPRDKLMHILKR